jgi:two-component sensor histidine kinase/ActR/RegA family two-component response regulator
MKILIVDDKQVDRYLLETLLKGSGYEVISATNGKEALEKLRTERVDLIISDVFMPVMDGFQLCQKVRTDNTLKDIPFVFYTATYTDPKDVAFALKLGADTFIRKPVDPDEFTMILQGVISDIEKGKKQPKKPALKEEEEILKLYSERLVNKLEQKMLELDSELIRRKETEEQLRASLREKELLLREIHHRTKNNMQVICALLNLQSAYVKDEQVLQLFKNTQDRIMSMALVHETLYRSDLSTVNLKEYIEDLVQTLLRSYQIHLGRVALTFDTETIFMSIDTAVPCGMMINELLSNVLKHAFPDGRTGEIRIALHVTDEGEKELRISDNGVGLPEDFDVRKTNTLGFRLVTMIAEQQLQGTVELQKREQGTEVVIRFKEPYYKKRI